MECLATMVEAMRRRRGIDAHAADGIGHLLRTCRVMMLMFAARLVMSAAGFRLVPVCMLHRLPPLETYTLYGYIEGMRKDIKASVQKRLGRIEGQVRGLSKMVDEDRYCIDIVTQISAVRAALRRVEEEVLRDHVAHCVEHAISSGNKADQREKITELMEVISRSDR